MDVIDDIFEGKDGTVESVLRVRTELTTLEIVFTVWQYVPSGNVYTMTRHQSTSKYKMEPF